MCHAASARPTSGTARTVGAVRVCENWAQAGAPNSQEKTR